MLPDGTKSSLVLQFPLLSQAATAMASLGGFLMLPPPARPSQDPLWLMAAEPDESDQKSADLRDGDGDVLGTSQLPFLAAPTARAVKATSARVICRCQPCQLRTS